MMNRQHPYKRYEKTSVWRALEKGIAELVENGDLAEMTPREYLVGHLTKLVLESPLSSKQLQAVREKIVHTREMSEELADALGELDKCVPVR